MRCLIFATLLMFGLGVTLSEADWISREDLKTGDLSQMSGYQSRVHCQRVEGAPCFNLKGLDPEAHKTELQRAGDFEPASAITDCTDQADCESQIADVVAKCGDASYQVFWGDLDNDSDNESWCTRRELVDVMVFDQAMKDAKDAAMTAKAAEALSRATKRAARVTRIIDACAKAPGPSTLAEARTCIRALARQMMESSMAEADL